MDIISELRQSERLNQTKDVDEIFGGLIQAEQYVGDVYSIGYESTNVQIHDFHRRKVGGIPSLCFLIATRVLPDAKEIDHQREDNSIILLRVMDSCALPGEPEAERIRVEVAQKVSGESSIHWDESSNMDAQTHNLLSFAGVKCRVIGTFYVDKIQDGKAELIFGSDISNYYPNRGLKVYKPNGEALASIVNYVNRNKNSHQNEQQRNEKRVLVGEVRYASTNRPFQGISDVKFYISPSDLLSQKTSLFGMTRTGKSNALKIIAQAVFELRFGQKEARKVGQIIFDQDGEYANDNIQDASHKKNPTALKNVWRINPAGKQEDVVTYGIFPHLNDPNRILMLLNFFEEANLQIGKQIIDETLVGDTAKYIQSFQQVVFEKPDPIDNSATIRYNRQVLVYRTLLNKAGFKPPSNLQPNTKGLFNAELIKKLEETKIAEFVSIASVLKQPNPTWGQLGLTFERLNDFLQNDAYKDFNNWYVNDRPKASGENWADAPLGKLLAMFHYPNGVRQIGKAIAQHSDSTTTDYADEIYTQLSEGRLVIIDQSTGDREINESSAKRIMQKVFDGNKNQFISGKTDIPEILVYIEEAHNLLPNSSELDLKNIWVRTAKEGAKFHIGMVYATQEVSSIQRNILKNTANWFISHLNNTDETRELCKYYDFKDFEPSILRAQDKGFVRVKTLSNPYVVPVQIRKFEV